MKKYTGKSQRLVGKNEMRMKLLVFLPSFQTEVRDIRKELGMPETGFQSAQEAREFSARSEKIVGSPDFLKQITDYEMLPTSFQLSDQPEEMLSVERRRIAKERIAESVPAHLLKNKVQALIYKYRLLPNFTRSLEKYVLENVIAAPECNWEIEAFDVDIEQRGKRKRLYSPKISLEVYAKLNKKEQEEATKQLRKFQTLLFPPEAEASLRIRKQFDRDLRLAEELRVKRSGHPVKRKRYIKGSYLHLAAKQKVITPKTKYQMEKANRGDIEVWFDLPTSRTVSRKEKIQAEAARKAVERLDKLARKLFGMGFNGH